MIYRVKEKISFMRYLLDFSEDILEEGGGF